MKKLHKELSAVAGFIGICLYHSETGPIAEAMPEDQPFPGFPESGPSLMEACHCGADHLGPVPDAAIYEAQSLIFIKKLSDEVFVYILAAPETNLFLLRIALDLIKEELLKKAAGFKGEEAG